MNTNEISEINVVELFTADAKYEIPLYQRAFAWEDREIGQLMDDIRDFKGENYYLGTLIVNRKKDGVFEVIDGQQRLTCLFLLLNRLDKEKVKLNLGFECRENANLTLDAIMRDSVENLPEKNRDEGILSGYKVIAQKLATMQDFESKLKKVKIYRIEVPPHTDLNNYFEVMNTRGEQLEQQDILKAELMKTLSASEAEKFALIWEACADMSGYVQMHFAKEIREKVFGPWWNEEPNLQKLHVNTKQTNKMSLKDIINGTAIKKENITFSEGRDTDGRFESFVRFPHFLLHTLKVYVRQNNLQVDIADLLDDTNLLAEFSKVQKQDKFAEKFIKCLLKCRVLFDKFIIKSDNLTNDWSLKELSTVGQGGNKKAYYKDTQIKISGEWGRTCQKRHDNILMMQACLRVSYISPKVMHWITHLLTWLYSSKNMKNLDEYEAKVESIIKDAVKNNYLSVQRKDMGVETPHIVFNYLDYLLWRDEYDCNQNIDKNEFKFEFRNSVEHWYPQHPDTSELPKWEDKEGLNCLGNLCLVSRRVNSRFSNLVPHAKKENYKDMIAKGSLKLRIMANLTGKLKNDNEWREIQSEEHGRQMMDILYKNLSD